MALVVISPTPSCDVVLVSNLTGYHLKLSLLFSLRACRLDIVSTLKRGHSTITYK